MNGFITKHTFFSIECNNCDEIDEVSFSDVSQAVDMFQRRGWRNIDGYWHCHSCAEVQRVNKRHQEATK